MRLVLIADTHSLHRRMSPIPDGDVLVHAGDVTGMGSLAEVAGFFDWFHRLPHHHKVVIAGNHDFAFERTRRDAEALVPPGVSYLRDSGLTIDGISFWGSPWQPWFYDWAFNLQRGDEIAAKWALIPGDVRVLITHGPPHGILDQTAGRRGQAVGCEALAQCLDRLSSLELHVFGHIHEGYGQVEQNGRTFVNASTCDLAYHPVNPPVVVDL